MQVEALFRPLSDLEKAIGDLYAEWAVAFDEDREAAFIFQRMANEEKGHASLVDYTSRVVEQNPVLSGEVDADLGVIETALQEIRAFRERPRPLALTDAVPFALWLETSAAESHYKNALRNVHVELQRLLSCLGGEDRMHIERLKTFAVSRGISPNASASG